MHLNTNKLGITLNVETTTGADLFKELVRDADAVVESFPPGTMASLGLSYEELEAINPRLVMVSVTPFGQTGPYKDFVFTELTAWAMGSRMSITGPDGTGAPPPGRQRRPVPGGHPGRDFRHGRADGSRPPRHRPARGRLHTGDPTGRSRRQAALHRVHQGGRNSRRQPGRGIPVLPGRVRPVPRQLRPTASVEPGGEASRYA